MSKVLLRELTHTDKRSFAKWWRDEELIKLTSGVLEPISDQEVDTYFSAMLDDSTDYHFMICLGETVIGHTFLAKRGEGWFETHIVVGEKEHWDKGYGTQAIRLLLAKAEKLAISKIFLEVRPDNLRAIRAYEKCGFKEAGIQKYPGDKYLPETLRMELFSLPTAPPARPDSPVVYRN